MSVAPGLYRARSDGYWWRGTDRSDTQWALPQPDVFVLGQTKPDAANTGVPVGVALRPLSATSAVPAGVTRSIDSGNARTTFTVTQAGLVLDSYDIAGYVRIAADNVVLRNCRITGGAIGFGSSGRYALVTNHESNAGQNLLIERCTLASSEPHFWENGVRLKYGTIRRCNIFHVVDGVNVSEADSNAVQVEGCWIHDLAFRDDSSDQANSTPPYWTHNDGVQISGGGNHQVRGCRIVANDGPAASAVDTLRANGYADLQWGACLTISPDKSQVLNVLVERNWLDGGDVAFQQSYLYGKATGTVVPVVTMRGNRIGRAQHVDKWGNQIVARYSRWVGVDWDATVFDPDDPAVPTALRGTAPGIGTADTGDIRIYQ